MAKRLSVPPVERGLAALGTLIPADNPRKIDPAAFKGLRASIVKFGLVQEIVVNKRSGRIVGGHQRVQALKVDVHVLSLNTSAKPRPGKKRTAC